MNKIGGVVLLFLAVGLYLFVALRIVELVLYITSIEFTSYLIGRITGSVSILLILGWLATKSFQKGLVLTNLRKRVEAE